MKQIHTLLQSILGIFIINLMLLVMPAGAEQVPPGAAPEGLSAAEWRSITQQIQQSQAQADDRQVRYSATSGPLAQQAYLKASNTDMADCFGYAVAVSGDTVVVGAPYENSNATGVNGDQHDNSMQLAGAAYVFVRSGTNWSQQAYLKASNTDRWDCFGRDVAIDGDTIVVGASNEDSAASGVNGDQTDNSASSTGAAYVFVRSGTSWSQQAYLKASNTDPKDYFGDAVAVDGDTIVVGAWGEDSNATGVNGDQSDNSTEYAGAAYVFVRSDTTCSQEAYLKASNIDERDCFGDPAVAIDGDTIVVSAVGEDSNATGVNGDQHDNSAEYAGAAYVFARNGTNWSQQAYLKASNTDAEDTFGRTVAVSGDIVVVGAEREDSAATGVNGDGSDNSTIQTGAAYVFARSGTTWSQQAYLKASNTDEGDCFGIAVAIDGDTVVVGAEREDGAATGVNGDQHDKSEWGSGAAYVFTPGYTISGTVTDGTNPLQGVTVSFSYDSHTETTTADGTYAYAAAPGVTTTITPSLTGYTFTPTDRTLTNITSDQPGQDFTGTGENGVKAYLLWTR